MTRDPDRSPPFFVGDHLAVDFLNTVATPRDAPIEWLADGPDLVDWLERAGAIEGAVATRFRTTAKDRQALDGVAAQAREFREWWRGFVRGHMGKPVPAGAVTALAPLNELLVQGTSYRQVGAAGSDNDNGHAFQLRSTRRWAGPEELLQPLAEAAADLLCQKDFRLVRACEGPACTLMFLDRTKAHKRRWCSMAVCGNRAKAAAHRARKTADGA